MVSFGENVTESDGAEIFHPQPLSIAVGVDHHVQHIGDAHLLLLMDQQRYVVYSFSAILCFYHVDEIYRNFAFGASNERTISLILHSAVIIDWSLDKIANNRR